MELQNTREKREAGNQQKSGSDQRGDRRLILWLVDLKMRNYCSFIFFIEILYSLVLSSDKFVKDAYPKVKDELDASRPDVNKEGVQSKDVINIIAKRWKEISAEEKLEWKHRAQAMSEVGTNEEEDIEPVEGNINGDNIIHEDEGEDNILLGESHPQNILNLHVPVAPALELGNTAQNLESVHHFAPIDIAVQLQMQMANVVGTTNINDSAGNERVHDIDVTGIQDPHVLGAIVHHHSHDTLNIGGESGLDHGHHGSHGFGNYNGM